MRAYGLTKGDDLTCDGGPPTKHRKITSKNRRTSRRIMKKKARNQSKRELARI
jgi:hypothetical protein